MGRKVLDVLGGMVMDQCDICIIFEKLVLYIFGFWGWNQFTKTLTPFFCVHTFISKNAFEILRTYIESRQSLEISQVEYNLECGVTFFFFVEEIKFHILGIFSVVNVNKF